MRESNQSRVLCVLILESVINRYLYIIIRINFDISVVNMSHLCFFYFDIKINDIVGEVVRLITDFIIIIQMDLEEKKEIVILISI